MCVHCTGGSARSSLRSSSGFFGSEIRRAGAELQEEAVHSLCRDLLQPQARSPQSTLVVNTLPWERTEVISSPGPDGTETLGTCDLGATPGSGFLAGAERAHRESLRLSLPWEAFIDCSVCSLDAWKGDKVP